jgi:hypothetical protein
LTSAPVWPPTSSEDEQPETEPGAVPDTHAGEDKEHGREEEQDDDKHPKSSR